jgi:quinol monooxygenase YgiN
VKPGHEQSFIAAWQELARVFSELEARPLWGTLVRSMTDSSVFYSFGPWRSAEDAQAMRADSGAQRAIAAVKENCIEAAPDMCEAIAHVMPDST